MLASQAETHVYYCSRAGPKSAVTKARFLGTGEPDRAWYRNDNNQTAPMGCQDAEQHHTNENIVPAGYTGLEAAGQRSEKVCCL